MTRRTGLLFARTIATLAVAAAVIGAAAACAPAQNIGHHPQAHPTKVVTTPTPTATPTPLAAPVIRVTESCAQLVPASALTTAIGVAVPAVTPQGDPDGETTYTQDGALTCNWSGDYAKDALQKSNHLVAWVLPDVSSANWASALKTLTLIGETKTTIIDGDAYAFCVSGSLVQGTFCSIDTRVGTTWLSFEVQTLSKSYAGPNPGLTHFAALINPIATAAGSAGFITEPRWTNTAATPTPTSCAALLPDSEITSVSGATGIGPIGPDLSDQESVADYWGAVEGIGEVDCDLASSNQQSGFFFSVVPGGSWAWSLVEATDNTQPNYTTVPTIGSQAVQYGNAANGGVSIDWVRGGNLCTINVSLPNSAKDAATAETFAAYINGEISN